MDSSHSDKANRTTTCLASDLLICATHGNIYAVNKLNGTLVWKCRPLPESQGGAISLFVTDSKRIIAGLEGKTFCINVLNGDVLWKNEMKDINSTNDVSILCAPSRLLNPNNLRKYTNDECAPPKYAEKSDFVPGSVVISCTDRNVMGMDVETGKTLWTYVCAGGKRSFSSVMLTEPSWNDKGDLEDLVYIGVGQWIHCLKARTGVLVWDLQLSHDDLGFNYMTIATLWSSRLSAETNTAFSQQPVVFAKRNDERGTEKKGLRMESRPGGW